MTDEELREHIALLRRVRTDFRHVEAKLAWGGLPKRLWETLSAFANTAGGGVIILGLDEGANFEVVGVESPRKIMQDLGSMTADMEPRLAPVIDVKEIDGLAAKERIDALRSAGCSSNAAKCRELLCRLSWDWDSQL